MKELLNPKVALACAGVTIGAVVMFVGTEDDPGSLHRTVQALDDEGAPYEQQAQRNYASELENEADADELEDDQAPDDRDDTGSPWADDDDLVDPTDRFDFKPAESIEPFKPIPQRNAVPAGAPGPLSEEAKAEIRARFGE